jgi:farnesyl diphosphate synthase
MKTPKGQAVSKHYQDSINLFLEQEINQLPATAPKLKQAMHYALLLGGKRIRPFLVYSVADMLAVPISHVHVVAAAVECIHAYSLVHDDLPAMDNDDLRRGQPTVHREFDEATAVLVGDALQSLAFELLSRPNPLFTATQQLQLTHCLAKRAGYQGMCGGQALDLEAAHQAANIENITSIHQLKTGALIECALHMAGIATSQDIEVINKLRQFGQHIGLAFQIQDDILDEIGDPQTLGKTPGSDAQANKSTFTTCMGLAKTQAYLQNVVEAALETLQELPFNCALLKEFVYYNLERNQ